MRIPDGLGDMNILMKRHQKARARQQQWRAEYREAYDYTCPERENYTQREEGQRVDRTIYDDTGVNSLTQFVSRIQGSLFPSWQRWVEYSAGSDIPEDQLDAAEKELEKSTAILFDNINHSNFNTEITPAITDMAIGMGCIMIEAEPINSRSAFRFTEIPLSGLQVEKPSRGRIKSVWREMEVAASSILDTWPEAEIPEELKRIIEDKPLDDVKIINAVIENMKTKKFNHIVIWNKNLIFTQEHKNQIMIVFRWSKAPNETGGRGVVLSAMPAIRTANKIKELMLANAAIQTSGVYTAVSDGLFNPHTATIAAGAIIPVFSNDNGNPTIRPLTPSGNIGVSLELLQAERDSIKKHMFVDPLGEINDPVRSATEQLIRDRENLKNSGASIGRLKTELAEPLVTACTDILIDIGALDPIKIDGKDVTLKHVSPQAKAEDLEAYQNVTTWLTSISQFLPPEIIAGSVKVEKLPQTLQRLLNVDPDLIRSEEEQQQLAEAAQEQLQAQQEAGIE